MRISARQIMAGLGAIAYLAAWVGWGVWLNWALVSELGERATAKHTVGLMFTGVPLGFVLVGGLVALWSENPSIHIPTFKRKSTIPKAEVVK